MKKALGFTYRLADTEIAYPQHPLLPHRRLHPLQADLYKAVGAGGHWQLNDSNPHFAAYQVLQNKATGAKFLFVAPHLTVNTGRRFDKMRKAETQTMINDANAYVASSPLPIVYAGDFNSDVTKHHAFDGPGIAMRAANVDDAFDVAQVTDERAVQQRERLLPHATGVRRPHRLRLRAARGSGDLVAHDPRPVAREVRRYDPVRPQPGRGKRALPVLAGWSDGRRGGQLGTF